MGSNRASSFSPEQDAIIVRDWPAMVEVHAIIAKCAAVPGRQGLSPMAVSHRASHLGVKRPAGWQRQAALYVRASGAGWRGPGTASGGRPRASAGPSGVRAVPLRELIRIGRELGLSGSACLDPERVSLAARRADPSAVGYRLVNLGGTMRAPNVGWEP